MKLAKFFFVVILMAGLLMPFSEAAPAPGKIPVKAIKKAGEVIGKGLRAINIAGTAHDIAGLFKPKPKKKKH